GRRPRESDPILGGALAVRRAGPEPTPAGGRARLDHLRARAVRGEAPRPGAQSGQRSERDGHVPRRWAPRLAARPIQEVPRNRGSPPEGARLRLADGRGPPRDVPRLYLNRGCDVARFRRVRPDPTPSQLGPRPVPRVWLAF